MNGMVVTLCMAVTLTMQVTSDHGWLILNPRILAKGKMSCSLTAAEKNI